MSDDSVGLDSNAIAIVGASCALPGAASLDQLWANLLAGRESLSRFSAAELAAEGVPPSELGHPDYVPVKGIVDGAEEFDADFFGFSAREAEIMDPQQRLFLRCAWEALEDAGHVAAERAERVGVFAGMGSNSYLLHNLLTNRDAVARATEALGPFHAMLLTLNSYLATRTSHTLDLRGPSLTVQTACSTSLVATHLACQSLLNHECDVALAGGVTLTTPTRAGYRYREGHILSADGHCRPFSDAAGGTVASNGAAVVLLKRWSDAAKAGDHVYALILGSAINNDGRDKLGFTAPSIDGQAEVISEALTTANVDPQTIGFVEAHGTGTPLGDPIEVAALTKAYRLFTDRTGYCALGSLKSNIGHVDTAAGVAGLLKAALSLRHGRIAPTLHYDRPNPAIPFAASPFFVNGAAIDWAPAAHPRRAAVSSFGLGGTNAHVILQAAPERPAAPSRRRRQLVLLSAKTATGLAAASTRLQEHLSAPDAGSLAAVAYTLQVGRTHWPERRFAVAADAPAAAQALAAGGGAGRAGGRARQLVFLLPGQGAQYVDMARGLYESEPTFQAAFDRCAEVARRHGDFDLRDVVYPAATADRDERERLLQRTEVTQGALFAVEYALAQTLIGWGLVPDALIGHSLGEYTAACLASVLTLEDALRALMARAAAMQALPRGAMLAVRAAVAELPALPPSLALAAVNSPRSCVVAGPDEAIDALAAQLASRGVAHKRLRTSHAFHSAMMESALPKIERLFAETAVGTPKIPYVSNLTGTWMSAAELGRASYWAEHTRATVRFGEGVATLLELEAPLFLEVGPGSALGAFVHEVAPGRVRTVRCLRQRDEALGDDELLLRALGQLWVEGATVDWQRFARGEPRRRVSLPTYPFAGKRHWLERGPAPLPTTPVVAPPTAEPVVDKTAPVAATLEQIWRDVFGLAAIDHDTELFALGGSSLVAVQILTLIRDRLGLRMAPAELLELQTIRRIATRLQADAAAPTPPAGNGLVALRRGDGQRALVLIHAVTGDVVDYGPLVQRLPATTSAWVIRAAGLDGEAAPIDRLEPMAEAYATALAQLPADAAPIVCGASFGGVVALEVARRLRAAGRPVRAVVMLDSPHPLDLGGAVDDHAALLAQAFDCPMERLRAAASDDERRACVVEWAQAGGSLPAALDRAAALARLRVWEANAQALRRHRPEPFAGRWLYFRARDRRWGRSELVQRPETRWIELAEGGLEVRVIDGSHTSILSGTGAQAIAERLERIWQE